MTYKVTLNGRTYEVEVEAGKAMLLAECEAIVPAAAVAVAPVVVETQEAEDDLFDDDWDSIDGVQEEEDDVKEFVPEIPAGNTEIFDVDILTDEDFDDPEQIADSEIDDDFEIDFSMFEVDEEKKRVREAERAENNSRKKKKKKR